MELSYDEGVTLLKQCWKSSGHIISPGKTVALNALKRHFQEKNIPYSHEEALIWLSENQANWDKQKFFKNRRAVFELNDVMTIGKIVGGYKYYDDPFADLSEYWQKKVTEYLDYQKTMRSYGAIRFQRIHCISFANFLTKNDIKQAENITGLVISKYYNYAVTVGDAYTSLYTVRYFLQFLVGQGLLPKYRPEIFTIDRSGG